MLSRGRGERKKGDFGEKVILELERKEKKEKSEKKRERLLERKP